MANKFYFGENHIPSLSCLKAFSYREKQYAATEEAFCEFRVWIISTIKKLHEIAYSKDRIILDELGVKCSFYGHDEKFTIKNADSILEIFVHFPLGDGIQFGASHTVLPNCENENEKKSFKFKESAYVIGGASAHGISFSTENISENDESGNYIEAISGAKGKIVFDLVSDKRTDFNGYYKQPKSEVNHGKFGIDTDITQSNPYYAATSYSSFEEAYAEAQNLISSFMREYDAVLGKLDNVKTLSK